MLYGAGRIRHSEAAATHRTRGSPDNSGRGVLRAPSAESLRRGLRSGLVRRSYWPRSVIEFIESVKDAIFAIIAAIGSLVLRLNDLNSKVPNGCGQSLPDLTIPERGVLLRHQI